MEKTKQKEDEKKTNYLLCRGMRIDSTKKEGYQNFITELNQIYNPNAKLSTRHINAAPYYCIGYIYNIELDNILKTSLTDLYSGYGYDKNITKEIEEIKLNNLNRMENEKERFGGEIVIQNLKEENIKYFYFGQIFSPDNKQERPLAIKESILFSYMMQQTYKDFTGKTLPVFINECSSSFKDEINSSNSTNNEYKKLLSGLSNIINDNNNLITESSSNENLSRYYNKINDESYQKLIDFFIGCMLRQIADPLDFGQTMDILEKLAYSPVYNNIIKNTDYNNISDEDKKELEMQHNQYIKDMQNLKEKRDKDLIPEEYNEQSKLINDSIIKILRYNPNNLQNKSSIEK